METWLSHVPSSEHADFCARFRSGKESEYTSALQEITLHELPTEPAMQSFIFHPNIPGATKQPDFKVKQPQGPEFTFSKARTSMEIESGPNGGTRAVIASGSFCAASTSRAILIGIDELIEGSKDLSQKTSQRAFTSMSGIKAAAAGYVDESISIPVLTTADGWRIKFTAFAASKYGPRRTTVMQEAWGRTWTGPSFPLRDALRKESQPLRPARHAVCHRGSIPPT